MYPRPPRFAWLNLMRQLILTPDQEGPRYRIGGDSADLTVYDLNPLPHLPSGEPLVHSLNSTELQSWAAALNATRSRAIIDLNFRQPNNASWAVSYVQAIERYIGWDIVVALEVGNEVDLYASNGIRNKTYSYQQYKAEFLLYTDAIIKAVPSAPKRLFQGLVTIFFDWLGDDLQDYLASTAPILHSISQHSYPVPSCNGEEVTEKEILDDAYATSTAQFLASHHTIQTLSDAGIEFVIGEGSEAVCNGAGPMTLNTFATALWAIHELFEVAAVGVKHWFFHSWGTDTQTFSVLVYGNPAAPTRFLVQPIYYGLRLFAIATANNATMVKTTVTSSNPHIHAYSTVSNVHTFSLVVLHKDLNATANATISLAFPLSGTAPLAVLSRLLAPSATAEYNITFAGQTYDGTLDGEPTGRRVDEQVKGSTDHG